MKLAAARGIQREECQSPEFQGQPESDGAKRVVERNLS
jgi:hypothetical protein